MTWEEDPEGSSEKVAVIMKGEVYRSSGLKHSDHPDLESELYDILCNKKTRLMATRDEVRKMAQSMALKAKDTKFNASIAWLDDFMRRFCLSRKKSGFHSQNMLKIKGKKGAIKVKQDNKRHNTDVEPVKSSDKEAGSNSNGTSVSDRPSSENGEVADIQDPSINKQDEESFSDPGKISEVNPEEGKKIEEGKANGDFIGFERIKIKSKFSRRKSLRSKLCNESNGNSNSDIMESDDVIELEENNTLNDVRSKDKSSNSTGSSKDKSNNSVIVDDIQVENDMDKPDDKDKADAVIESVSTSKDDQLKENNEVAANHSAISCFSPLNGNDSTIVLDSDEDDMSLAIAAANAVLEADNLVKEEGPVTEAAPFVHPPFMIKVRNMSELLCSPESNKMPSPVPEKREPVKSTLMSLFRTKGKEGNEQSSEKAVASPKGNEAKPNNVAALSVKVDESKLSKISTKGKEIESDEDEMVTKRKKDAKTGKQAKLTKDGSEGEDGDTDSKATEEEEEEEETDTESTSESEKSLMELTGSGDSDGGIGECEVSENSDGNDVQQSQWDKDNAITYTKKENKLYRRTSKELLSNVESNMLRCTACNEQVNHKMDTLVFTHPTLGVLMCKRCRKFYGKGTFKRDSDGLDEYCSWCANGGDLLVCDKCTSGFCKPCVRRNLGRSALSGIERCKEWSCYRCDMKPLMQVRLQHRAVLDNIRIMRNKQQNKSRMEKKKSEMTNKFEALKMLRKSKEPVPVAAAAATVGEIPIAATLPPASNPSAPWLDTCMTDLIDMLQVCTSQVSRVQAKWGGVATDSSNDVNSTRLQCSRRLLRLMRAMTDNFEAVEKKFLMNCGEDREELQKVLDVVAAEKGLSSANRLQASADTDMGEVRDNKAEENCDGFSSGKCLDQPTEAESDTAVLSSMETEDNQVSDSEAADNNIKSTVKTKTKRKGGEEASVLGESEENGLESSVNVKKTNRSMKNDSEDERMVEPLRISLRSRNKVNKPEVSESEEEKMSKSERSRSLRYKNRSKINELEEENISKSVKSRSSRSRNRCKDSESEEENISKSEKSRCSPNKKESKDSESEEEKIKKSEKSDIKKKGSKDSESEEETNLKSEKSRNSRSEKPKDCESEEESVSETTEKVRKSSRRRGRDTNDEEDKEEAAIEEQDNARSKKRKGNDKESDDTTVKASTLPSGSVSEPDVSVPEADATDNSELEDADLLMSKETEGASKEAEDVSQKAEDASQEADDASQEADDASKTAEDASQEEEAASDTESEAEGRRRSSRVCEKVQLKYAENDDSDRVKSKKRKRKSSTTNEDKKDDSEKCKKLKKSKTGKVQDNSEDEDEDKITEKEGKIKKNKLNKEGESDCDADTESDVDDTNKTKSPKKVKKKKKDKQKNATDSENEEEEAEEKSNRKSRKMPKLTDHDSDDNNKKKSKSKKKGKKKDKYDDVDSDEFEKRKKAYLKRERSKLDKEKESESDNSEETAEDHSKEVVDEESDAACAKEEKKGDADCAKKNKDDSKKDKEKSVKAVDKSEDSKLSRSGEKCSDEDMFASSGGDDTAAEAEPLLRDGERLDDDKEDTKGASDVDKDNDALCEETSLFDRLKNSSKKQGNAESKDKKSHGSTKTANEAAFNDLLNEESDDNLAEQIHEDEPVDQSDTMEEDGIEKNDSPEKDDKLNVKSQSSDKHDQVKKKEKDNVPNSNKIKLKGSCRKTTRAKITKNEEAKESILGSSDSESGAKIEGEKSITKKENKEALNDLLASDSDSDSKTSKVTKTANDAAKKDILASDNEDVVKNKAKAKSRSKSVNDAAKKELLESSDSDKSKSMKSKTSKKSKMASRNESAKKDLLASDSDASITARTYKKSDKKSKKKESKAKGEKKKDPSEAETKDSAGTSSDISSDDLLGIGGIESDEEEKQKSRPKKHKASPRVVQERRQERQLKQLRPVVEVQGLAAAVEERLKENEGTISLAEYKKIVRTERKQLKSKAKKKKGLCEENISGSDKEEGQDGDEDSDAEFKALMKFKLKKKLSSKLTKSEEEEEGGEGDSDDAKSGKENKDKKSGDEVDKDTKSKGDSKKKQKKEGLLDISLHSGDENAEDEEEDDTVKKKEVKKSDPTSTFNEKMKKTLLQSSDEEAHGSDSEDSVTRRERELLEDEKKKRYEKMKARQKEKDKKEKEAEGENEDEEEDDGEEKKDENEGDEAQEEKGKPVGKKGYMSLKFSSDEEDEEKKKAGKNNDEDFEEEEEEEEEEDDSDDSEYESPRKSRMFIGSDSDSDFVDTKKRSNRKKEPSSDSDDSSEQDKKPRKKRIRKASSSSDEEEQGEEGDKNEEVTEDTPSKRKHRRIIRDEDLTESTKNATQQEEDRRARIKDRQQVYNKIFEIDVEKDQAMLKSLVLDFDSDTKKELVSVHQKLVPMLKPHQAQGIKFMWDATCESVERVKDERGSGAILAHCMGLGKTLQVIVFLHTLLTNARLQSRIQRVLVLCPVNTVYNWVSEFKKWLKGKMLPFDVIELISAKDLWNRAYRLEEWHNETGVCIIGYDMYRTLANEKHKKYKGKMKQIFQKTLVDPGPDFVICDEGHILKNEKTALALAVNKMKTARRVVLTGTPLQNNLKEYHCMIQFVKPNLLGTRKEFLNRFVNPITAGSCADATPRDVKRMKRRAHILHNLLEGCVQRFDYTVLKPFLPPKMEYVISVQMSDLQCKLYTYYLENLAQGGPKRLGSGLFVDFNNLSRVWTHPKVLDLQLRRAIINDSEDDEMEDFICDDETTDTSEDDRPRKKKKKSKKESEEEKSEESKPASPALDALPDGLLSNGKVRPDWWKKIVSATMDDDNDSGEGEWMDKIELSGKLVLLLSILRECCSIGDKVLLFSQSILALDMIEEFLSLIDHGDLEMPEHEDALPLQYRYWKRDKDYLRLDGSVSADIRKSQCKFFNENDNDRCRLFLISTRAGGIGINLVAANRVIIFDSSWNPAHDTQSIFRVYRFGQTKPCYIYRFVAQGTMEEKIYSRQVNKLSTSLRVVDEHQIKRYFNTTELADLYEFNPADAEVRETPIVPEDRLLAELIIRYKHWIVGYHEHDSLLENQTSEELSEEERKAAWEDFENEKKGMATEFTGGGRVANYGGVQFQTTVPAFDINQVIQSIYSQNPNLTPAQLQENVVMATRQIQKIHLNHYQRVQAHIYNLKNPMIAPEIRTQLGYGQQGDVLPLLQSQLSVLEDNIRRENQVISQMQPYGTQPSNQALVSAGLTYGNPAGASTSGTAVRGVTSNVKQYVDRSKASHAAFSNVNRGGGGGGQPRVSSNAPMIKAAQAAKTAALQHGAKPDGSSGRKRGAEVVTLE